MEVIARCRTHSVAFKRQVVQAHLAGETLRGLALRHDLSRNLIRVWVAKYRAGALDEDVQAADLLQEYEARIAMLERVVGRPALEIEYLKGKASARTIGQKRDYVRRCRPDGLSVSRGCALIGLPRSTFYDPPATSTDATELLARLTALCDAFERYGYRPVGAALRQQGIVVNGKKLRRLMREHSLQPRRCRRFKATTDSDHDLPVFPNVAAALVPDGPNQLWIADLTYIAVPNGFVYLAVILDTWSRKAVGYAVSCSLEARTAVAALKAALAARSPPNGCVHHSDSQKMDASSRAV